MNLAQTMFVFTQTPHCCVTCSSSTDQSVQRPNSSQTCGTTLRIQSTHSELNPSTSSGTEPRYFWQARQGFVEDTVVKFLPFSKDLQISECNTFTLTLPDNKLQPLWNTFCKLVWGYDSKDRILIQWTYFSVCWGGFFWFMPHLFLFKGKGKQSAYVSNIGWRCDNVEQAQILIWRPNWNIKQDDHSPGLQRLH